MSNLMTIRPLGAEIFHADGQTDRQTDRHTDRQTDRQTDGRTDGRREKHDVADSRFSQFCQCS